MGSDSGGGYTGRMLVAVDDSINPKSGRKIFACGHFHQQAASMLKGVFDHFQQPILAVTDSWFGNDGLWSRLDRVFLKWCRRLV